VFVGEFLFNLINQSENDPNSNAQTPSNPIYILFVFFGRSIVPIFLATKFPDIVSPVLSPLRYCLIVVLFVGLSCVKTNPAPPPPAPNPNPSPTPPPPPPPPSPTSSQKEITSFVFRSADNSALGTDVNGTIGLDTINLIVPANLPLANLVPSISFKGKSISPQGSVAQNFTQAVTYTVTADDSSTKKYLVRVVYQSLAATIFLNTINMKPSTLPGNKGYLYAIDPATGILRWKYQPGANGFYGSPAFSNNILYTANRDTVIAMDVTSRAIKWKYKTNQVVQTSLLLANGALYINCSDGTFYSFDPATGNLKWKITYNAGSGNAQSSPTFVDGTLYCGGTEPAVFAIDGNNGTIKWKTRFPSLSLDEVISSPSVVNGVVYVGDTFGNVLALNASDGTVKWSFKGQGAIISSPTVVNGIVYLGDSHYLYAFDSMTGSMKWQFPAEAGVSGSPLFVNGLLYFAGTNLANQCKLYAVDAVTGQQKWQYTHPVGADYVNPVAFSGDVFFDIRSDLVSLEAATGTLKWVFHADYINEDTWGAPCIVDDKGNVYYSSESGHQQ
jgi:eukaryotic-like serine/threonine-protein kinase